MRFRWASVREVAALAWRDYLRTPEAVFWTYGFPFVMTLVLGFAFGESAPEPSRVGVVGAEFAESFRAVAGESDAQIRFVAFEDQESVHRAMISGRIDAYLLGSDANEDVVLDAARPGAVLAELRLRNVLHAFGGGQPPPGLEVRAITEPGGRYVDFVLPGLIALNLLGAGGYGIGYNITQLRAKKLFRRLWVTPVGRAEFLLGFLGARGLLALVPPFVILLFGSLTFGVPVRDGLPMFALLVVVGAFAFSGLGLLISSRARTLEAVSGLMNLVMLPMWLLGGAFYSTSSFPEVVQPLLRAVPLSWLCDGLRSALLDMDVSVSAFGALGLLVGFGVLTFGLALRLFRWT
ncbi:MAG: ABC transporter permease [Planctomycetota bacterium]